MQKANKIKLRQVAILDKPTLATLANNLKIWSNLRDAMPHPYTLEDAENFINGILSDEQSMKFAIEYDGQFCGMIGLHPQPDIYRQSLEIGYWIGEPFWGKGIGTKAVELATALAFERGYVRVFAGVFEPNIASQKVLEKNGYFHEGTAKYALTKNGKIFDEIRYAKTKLPINCETNKT